MKKNSLPTAVYLHDGDVFRLIMVENKIRPVTAKLGQALNRVIDEIGMLSLHNYPNLEAIVRTGEKANIKVLRSEVRGIDEVELSETLFSVLRLNFKLLDLSVPHMLFLPQDRQELLNLGFELIYSEQNGIVTETAYYSVDTIKGWASFLTLRAMYYNIESYITKEGSMLQFMPELHQSVEWVARTSSIDEARMIHQWAHRLKEIEDIHVAVLHEGEDRKNLGHNPLMAYVWVDGRPLTCFANWKSDPLLKGKTARDFNNCRMFIRIQKPQSGSGQKVGKFTLVPEHQVQSLLSMA